MKQLRMVLDALVVLVSTVVLGSLAYQALGGKPPQILVDWAVLVLDAVFVLAALANIPVYREGMAQFVCGLIPIAAYLIALLLTFLHITVSPVSLIVFDFYVIYWFGYLLLKENRSGRRW